MPENCCFKGSSWYLNTFGEICILIISIWWGIIKLVCVTYTVSAICLIIQPAKRWRARSLCPARHVHLLDEEAFSILKMTTTAGTSCEFVIINILTLWIMISICRTLCSYSWFLMEKRWIFITEKPISVFLVPSLNAEGCKCDIKLWYWFTEHTSPEKVT